MSKTIKDIANQANVSIATVSRVLNNKPDVSKDTREKILKIIKELNYNPNDVARGLVLQHTKTLGLIIPDISNSFFSEVALGVEDKAKELGYSVIFCNTRNNKDEEKDAIRLLRGKRVDGIILSPSIGINEELQNLKSQNYPVVQIDREIESIPFPKVMVDNFTSAYNATRYLIDQGHKKIAHITGDLNTNTGQERLKGFRAVLRDTNIPVKKEWILNGDYTKESGFLQMKKLLLLEDKPSAIFVANDLMALGCYEAVFNSNYKIPENFSIIGHDDIKESAILMPGLTTMKQNKRKIGAAAAELIIDSINRNKEEGGAREDCNNIILQTDMVVRNSTTKFGVDGKYE